MRAYLNFLPSLMARQHPDIKMAQVNLLEVLKDYLTERGPGELFTKFQTSFYAEPIDAVVKALGVD